MNQTINEENALKQYLLGRLCEEEQAALEERLLTAEDFFERLNMAEDELIDEYTAGGLKPDDVESFNHHFMAPPERQYKVRFGIAFSKYISRPPDPVILGPWTRFASNTYLRIAAFIILMAGVGFGIYRGFFYESGVDKGLAALKAAYPKDRPVQARIAGWGYRTFRETRGGDSGNVDRINHDRAQAILRGEFERDPGPESNHAVGVFLLTNKDFDKAIDHLRKAVDAAPLNAQYRSDLAAALLEKFRADKWMVQREKSQQALGKGEGELSQCEAQIESALALNPSLLEALFNRALCHMEMKMSSNAKKDWEEYLIKIQIPSGLTRQEKGSCQLNGCDS